MLQATRGPLRGFRRPDGKLIFQWPVDCVGCADEVWLSHAQYVGGVRGVCSVCKRKGVRSEDDGAAADSTRPGPKGYEAQGREYAIWVGIKDRCLNPASEHWPRYGGAGIGLAPEWQKSFAAFFEHMGKRPSAKHSVGRLDNAKGYEPGNVRWEIPEQQARNQTHNRKIEHEGRTMLLVEWAEELGLSPSGLAARLKKMDAAQALSKPGRPYKKNPALDDREDELVRRYRAGNESAESLARAFGVSRTLVDGLLTRTGARRERIEREEAQAATRNQQGGKR